jgi:glycosyltransferase involved in cell wall biosynthesis
MCPSLDVSVVIPTYNRARWLPATLASILGQTLSPSEIVVVDDGSTDGTEALALSFPPSVKYVQIPNSGVCRARNVGATHARCSWVAFCDSDDLWHPRKLEAQAALLGAVPGLEYVFTNFSVVRDNTWSTWTKFDEAPTGYWDIPRRQISPEAFVIEVPLYEHLLAFQPIFPSTMLMSQSFARRVGPWIEALGRSLSEDLEFILRCVARAPIGVVTAPLVGIRKHPDGFSSQPLRTLWGEIEILRYVLAHHPEAADHERAIRRSIETRYIAGAELAFALGRLDQVEDFLRQLPAARRRAALRLKALIAGLPRAVAEPLRAGVVGLSALMRRRR